MAMAMAMVGINTMGTRTTVADTIMGSDLHTEMDRAGTTAAAETRLAEL